MHRRGHRHRVSARRRCRKIYDALMLEDDAANTLAEKGLTFEVEQQLGDGVVRTHRAGLLRRPAPRHEGERTPATPISVPVGPGTLGRIMDVLGRPIDERGPIKSDEAALDPPAGAEVRRAVAVGRAARDRHQGDRPDLPVRQGRQDRPVRRRRRRQDREHAGADQQHRHAALGPVGVRRRRRAHARGQRLLSRDDRSRGHQAGRPGRSRRWRWCSAR